MKVKNLGLRRLKVELKKAGHVPYVLRGHNAQLLREQLVWEWINATF